MNNQDQEFDLFNSPLTGINLIAASAGTGKTYTIAHLFTRLVVEKKIPVVVTLNADRLNSLETGIG